MGVNVTGALRNLTEICDLPTAPFHEHMVIDWLGRHLDELDGVVWTRDRYGNLLVEYRRGRERERPLVLAAHLDHPGFHVLAGGTEEVKAEFLGGVREEYFPGTGVIFFPGKVRGEVAEKVADENNPHKVFRIRVEAPVATGAFAMWDLPPAAVNGDRVTLRVADDLAGVAAVYSVLEELASEKVEAHLRAVFTRAEEVGFAGALAFSSDPRWQRQVLMLAVETSKELPGVAMGEGPIIRVGDRASVFHAAGTRLLDKVASELGKTDPEFSHQRALMSGGTCESSAYQQFGFPSAALCVALGNYHNMGSEGIISSEIISRRDYLDLVKLFRAAVTTHWTLEMVEQEFRENLEKRLKRYGPRLEATLHADSGDTGENGENEPFTQEY